VTTLLHWFRRDLRVRDNVGLATACAEAGRDGAVAGVFVVDPRWWHADARKLGPWQAAFWFQSLRELRPTLRERNVPLVIRLGDPVKEIITLAKALGADTVTHNKEYEPAQREMDDRLAAEAAGIGLKVRRFKDAAVFEEEEILTAQGGVYGVFTPYQRAYLKKLAEGEPDDAGLPRRVGGGKRAPSSDIPTLRQLGFDAVDLDISPGERCAARMLDRFCDTNIQRYDATRDWPALRDGTSRLSAHLNAGTISIRQVMRAALEAQKKKHKRTGAETFLGELIWREFYRMVLYHHPHTLREPYQEQLAALKWRNDPVLFEAWRDGLTGYPIVDAGMRQFAHTGFMHNRLRMITAMFLTKDLDTHWVQGERYFRRMLMDYDQASNVGGWQWSASVGTDAAPYFRVMNPVLQGRRFDPDGDYVRRWVPELRRVATAFIHVPWEMPSDLQRLSGCMIGREYPAPIVNHQTAKAAAIAKFRQRSHPTSSL
jgi:deoxyribodipyrimidine photo-lyase